MLRQLFYIIIGFMIGQGSMFLVQSTLVIDGQFELISQIGIALGLLSFMQWVADGGGVFLLSKINKSEISKLLPNFIASRLIFSIIIFIIFLMILKLFELNAVVQDALYFTPLVILVWAFNLTGVIDKYEKNRIVGPVSSLNWLFSSVVLLLFTSDENLGFYSGAAYVLGLSVTVAVQYGIMRKKLNLPLQFSLSSIKKFMLEIAGYNLSYISGQGYGRVIPILIDNSLNSTLAGMYIYAKNISNISSQLILFIRRVEYSRIMALLENEKIIIRQLILVQKNSIFCGFCFFILALISFILIYYLGYVEYQLLASICLLMFFILIIWIFSSSLGQIFVAQGKLLLFGMIVSSTTVLSIVFISIFIDTLGVYLVLIVECVMLSIQTLIYFLILKFQGNRNV